MRSLLQEQESLGGFAPPMTPVSHEELLTHGIGIPQTPHREALDELQQMEQIPYPPQVCKIVKSEFFLNFCFILRFRCKWPIWGMMRI